MFTVEQRDALRDRVLELAEADPRVVAGAIVGSLAEGGDRWSDLDLTFGIADGEPVAAVLEEWTALVDELDAVVLFDLPSGPSIYRVFLMAGALQFDLSFTPASQFAATSPRFELFFGAAGERKLPLPAAEELLGWAAHHALRARFCIERGSNWQAEYWTSSVRDYALSIECRRRDLPPSYGRGYDDLPGDVRDAFADALVRSLDREELLRALGVAIDGLLWVAEGLPGAAKIAPRLRELQSSELL